ncbi:bifunctional NAD(P)H-hydrate repair enzyme [Tateyamaria omphalii]|uniref:NAD(P)H-hydrate dehydratase n=1 Tax=Tateyamaria omphalii TaxID=299262 RepID=UPI001673D252|nr:NAD(P)H-hydrate dehydratase [Tateyamaria omphalii]GGX48213.1 bifunctional NAD(P)H-hydrate repair enzyme [Tateyamaria omphalii]
MTELLTAAQMRAIEQAAIESGEVTGFELMERAGAGVVEAVFEEWPELSDRKQRAVVLCGPGNNGGDGFVVARLLKARGWAVEVFLYGDPDKLPPDAQSNYDLWAGMGEVKPLDVSAVSKGRRPALMVDAMFGTGLTRAIPLDCAVAHEAVRKRDVGDEHPWLVPYHVVAVDCPSGMDCDSGHILMPEYPKDIEDDVDAHWRWWKEDASKRLLQTDLTVTFHRRKVGHYLGQQNYALRVVDIGLGEEDRHPAHLRMTRDPEVACLVDFDPTRGGSRKIWPYDLVAKRSSAGRHKFDHGHALVLTGGAGRTGAARLAALGALRIGAGLVTLGTPPAAQMEVASHITALMLARIGDADALTDLLDDERINALCLGPGLGLNDHAAALVDAVLGGGHLRLTRHVVFDADALTLIAQDARRMEALNEHAVLTPHGGEFARLFPDIAEKLSGVPDRGPAYSKVDATRDAAARCGAIILFKGPDTVIAHPDGRCSVHAAAYGREAPWLATAGAGDVLAGFITGLLARGLEPMDAAEIAAWLHVECARAFGPGLIAEDLPEILPQVLRDIGA